MAKGTAEAQQKEGPLDSKGQQRIGGGQLQRGVQSRQQHGDDAQDLGKKRHKKLNQSPFDAMQHLHIFFNQSLFRLISIMI